MGKSADDALTLASLGIVAYALAIVSHEGLGHGLTALAAGARPLILTTCNFDWNGSVSGSSVRWIAAAGSIANALVGLLCILLSRLLRAIGPHLRLFLVLAAAFNLLLAAGYPGYSGVAAFGDWTAVIRGFSPEWLWRVFLVVGSVIAYSCSLRLLAVALRPFCGSSAPESLARLRRMTMIPYLAAVAAACLAGAFNPGRWTVLFTCALPSSAAAGFGLTRLDHFPGVRVSGSSVPAGAIPRNFGWILAAVVILVFFVGVLGPGIRFQPGR